MRPLLLSILLFLLLFVACLLAVDYIQQGAARLSGHFDALEASIRGEDWEQAFCVFAHCVEEWAGLSSRWKSMINHEDMRDIEIGFVELRSMLELQEAEQALEEMATLRYYMRHVPENEALRLSNVL
ncbi:MAG: DUF4363 family protein [Bacillota bacterium]|nr:DUF4363 family protein [Bacillota bacterium]